MEPIISLYITVPSEEEGKLISQQLLENRLVACVNILPNATSMYWWQGKIVEDTEFVLIAKSKEILFEKIEKKVKEFHSYDCPCIVAHAVENASEDYVTWIKNEVQ